MNPCRILIFSTVYYPRFIGGAEVAVKEITDRISPQNIEFDIVTLRLDSSLPRYEKIGNVNVYRVGWSSRRNTSPDSLSWYLHLNKYAFLLTGFLKAISLNRKRKYNTIWSLMASYNSFAAIFFKLTHPRIRFIFTLQDGDPIPYLKKRARPLYPFFRMFFTKADHIQAISNYLADWAKDMGARCPVSVVPNAVDYDLFSKTYSTTELETLKKSLGKKDGDVFLITTSRLVAKNGIGDIINALSFLPSNVKLIILGQGYQEDILKSQTSRLKLEDRVRFMGFITHEKMPQYLQISDIFIRPALSEGLGNSFLEAMAAGIPIIGTQVGGILDFLKDGETGLFCEVQNPKSIVQKIEKLMKDRESRDYIVKQARSLVERKYQWEKIAKDMEGILRS